MPATSTRAAETQETRKNGIRALLKGLETGDPASVDVIHPDHYTQHNPQTQTGRAGLAALFAKLSKTAPRVNLVRVFSDGDYVFAHTEYDFSTRRIGFEVFRFEGAHTVEHWDNIQPRQGPNASGHSMVDGPTEATDLADTERNRDRVRTYLREVVVNRRHDRLAEYLDPGYTQHNAELVDGIEAVRGKLERSFEGGPAVVYTHVHRVLAEGNFVLAVSEGQLRGVHSAFYDLFRVADVRLVEHWDTIEAVAPKSEWQHDNGKF
ncbi:MAG: nuclear transport factor 2 family protein [Myxococcota bacterium]